MEQLILRNTHTFLFWCTEHKYRREGDYSRVMKGLSGIHNAIKFWVYYILWNYIITIVYNYVIMSCVSVSWNKLTNMITIVFLLVTNYMSYSWVNNNYIIDTSVLVTTYVFTLCVLYNSSFLAEFCALIFVSFCFIFSKHCGFFII